MNHRTLKLIKCFHFVLSKKNVGLTLLIWRISTWNKDWMLFCFFPQSRQRAVWLHSSQATEHIQFLIIHHEKNHSSPFSSIPLKPLLICFSSNKLFPLCESLFHNWKYVCGPLTWNMMNNRSSKSSSKRKFVKVREAKLFYYFI